MQACSCHESNAFLAQIALNAFAMMHFSPSQVSFRQSDSLTLACILKGNEYGNVFKKTLLRNHA